MAKLVTAKKILDVTILDKLIQVKESRLIDLKSLYEQEGILGSKAIDNLEDEITALKDRKRKIEDGQPVDVDEEESDGHIYISDTPSVQHIVTVNWEDVSFGDGRLIIKVEGKIYTYKRSDCRSSYNFIKPILIKRLSPFKVIIDDEQIVDFIDYSGFKNALTLLEFRNTFHWGSQRYLQTSSIQEYIKKFSSILPHLIACQDKTPYLNYLCKIQSEQHALVPFIEVLSHGDSYTEEDAFLFTVKTKDDLYVVWENMNPSRATYVFAMPETKYLEQLQKIFDFATSSIICKRSKIYIDRQLRQELGLNKIIRHTYSWEWERNFPYAIRYKDESDE